MSFAEGIIMILVFLGILFLGLIMSSWSVFMDTDIQYRSAKIKQYAAELK